MPNIISARKRARQARRRTEINTSRMSRIRTAIRKVEEAIAAGDKDAAQTAFKAAEPEIMRGVTKKIIHKRTGARQVSRLAAGIKALSS